LKFFCDNKQQQMTHNMMLMTTLLLATILFNLPTAEAQAPSTSSTVTTTPTSTSTTTTTTNSTNSVAASTTTSSLPPTTTVCQVVAFELRHMNASTPNKTVAGDCLPALSAVFSPVGGDSLACAALKGCGVANAGGVRRRQTASNYTGPAINGTAEAIQVSFSAPVLLWQVDFGAFDAGLDTATLELTSLYTNATVNFTAASTRWTALSVVIESGVEPPVVKSLRIRADSFSSFTLLSVRAKPYIPPPSIVFTTTAGNATTANANATTSTAEPTLDPNASFGEMLEFWMENEALYFWLVIAAIILLLICCIVAIVVCICCCCCGGEEEDEMYSMRDASSAYRDDDWL
jgi:hypothetical protein